MSFRRWLRLVASILLPGKRSTKRNRRPKFVSRSARSLALEFLEDRTHRSGPDHITVDADGRHELVEPA